MRTTIHCRRIVCLGALSIALAAAGTTPLLHAQAARPASYPPAEIAVTFEHLNSNTLPAGCGCFGLNGGSATFALRPRLSHLAGIFDFGVVHTGDITASNYTLTIVTFMVGARYLLYTQPRRLQPYLQAAIGGAHSAGTLVEGYGAAGVSPGAGFAGSIGGGLDVRIGRRFAIRAIEADYLATTFSNGVNNHQNNLRLDAGVVLHF